MYIYIYKYISIYIHIFIRVNPVVLYISFIFESYSSRVILLRKQGPNTRNKQLERSTSGTCALHTRGEGGTRKTGSSRAAPEGARAVRMIQRP